jgi:hypothetical protein
MFLIASWSRRHPDEVLGLMERWEVAKCMFSGGEDVYVIELPPHLLEEMSEEERAVLRVNHDGYDDRVLLLREDMRGFFDRVLDDVVNLAMSQV